MLGTLSPVGSFARIPSMADPRPKCNLLPFTNKFFASSASRSSCSEHVQALRDEVKAEALKGMFRGPWGSRGS